MFLTEPVECREGYHASSSVATDQAEAAGPAIYHTHRHHGEPTTVQMSNPIHLTGERLEDPRILYDMV